MSTSWREQRRIFHRVETDEAQRALEVRKALFGRQVRTEPVAAPFGDRVQRGVLQ